MPPELIPFVYDSGKRLFRFWRDGKEHKRTYAQVEAVYGWRRTRGLAEAGRAGASLARDNSGRWWLVGSVATAQEQRAEPKSLQHKDLAGCVAEPVWLLLWLLTLGRMGWRDT